MRKIGKKGIHITKNGLKIIKIKLKKMGLPTIKTIKKGLTKINQNTKQRREIMTHFINYQLILEVLLVTYLEIGGSLKNLKLMK